MSTVTSVASAIRSSARARRATPPNRRARARVRAEAKRVTYDERTRTRVSYDEDEATVLYEFDAAPPVGGSASGREASGGVGEAPAKASNAEANARDAQKWIDAWKSNNKTAAPAKAPVKASNAEANARDAQKWIDAWKSNNKTAAPAKAPVKASNAEANARDAQKWIDAWKSSAKSAAPAKAPAKASNAESNARDAQKWIDAWKSNNKTAPPAKAAANAKAPAKAKAPAQAKAKSKEPAPAKAPVPSGPMVPQYGDAQFDALTRQAFDSGEAFVADAEEARVLWDDGWDFLDVRCKPEVEFFGSIPNPPKGTIGGHNEVVVVSGPEKVRSVPLVTCSSYRYSSEVNAKVFNDPKVDAEWLKKVEKEFPDKKGAKIVVVCSDGRQRAIAALELLESAGYERLVLLKGGHTLYNRGWDGRLKRRLPHGEFKSDYRKPGDVQQFSRGDRAGNANDAIEFGPWVDAFDWKPALTAAGLVS